MMYDDLKRLEEMRNNGSLTEDEFQQQKAKLLSNGNTVSDNNLPGNLDLNTYLLLMHLSQFAGYMLAGLGFVIPIVMWLMASKNKTVDQHGKNIVNFLLSTLLYSIICIPFCFILIGFFFLACLGLLVLISVIMASIHASKGEYWKYPLTISFFK